MNFSPDSKFFNFMSKLGDFVVLNILFIITCIPIFTIGASFCALYTVCKKRLADEESYIIRGYLAIWKENFKNATIMWVFFLVWLPILLSLTNLATKHLNNVILFSFCLLIILWYIFSMLYAFPLQASFINTPFRIILNSFLTAMAHLPYTIVLFAVTMLPAVITWLFPGALYFTFTYWLLIGFSLNGILSVLITERVFRHYRPKETEETKE